MGWKFWKREQTEAERSLAALQQGSVPPPAAVPTLAPEVALTPGQAHMERVMKELEELVGAHVPTDEQGTFMLEVTGVEAVDGALVLTGGAHEGQVDPGALVGLMVLPLGAMDVGDDPQAEDEALLGVRARSATVVSWAAEPPVLVVSGLQVDDVTIGSMVTR